MILLIINNRSGNFAGKRLAQSIAKLPNAREIEVIDFLDFLKNPTLSKNYSTVLIAGGDGTVSAVLQNLPSDAPPSAILGLGTGNDLLRALALDRYWRFHSLEAGLLALDSLPVSHLRLWSVKDIESKATLAQFTNYFSVGFSAEVVETFDRLRNSLPKPIFSRRLNNLITYLYSGLRHLYSRVPPIEIESGRAKFNLGKSTASCCLYLANIDCFGGMARFAASTTEQGEIPALQIVSPWDYLIQGVRVPMGQTLGYSKRWILRFEQPLTKIQVDGETKIINSKEILVESSQEVRLRYLNREL